MTDRELFRVVGIRPAPNPPIRKAHSRGIPRISVTVAGVILLGCLLAEAVMTKDPGYLDLSNCNVPPGVEFLFGTDALGRDIFSGIWYGGRISIAVGFLATLISVLIAFVYGAVSGTGPRWLDNGMMRFAEICQSVPGLLVVLFLQALLGEATVWSLALVIGVTGWTDIARIVRTEVRQLRSSGFVLASKCMGGGFFHILRLHLAPNILPSILFMVVMSIRSAIAAESTLSFMGMGLPLGVISWGSMLSLADRALLTGSWWAILIPGGFLTALLVCLTNIGNYLRANSSRRERNL